MRTSARLYLTSGQNGRNYLSSLWNSARAERVTCPIPIGRPSAAARKAAFTAIIVMLPPAISSRASASKSRPSMGASRGNARSQIARRSAASGKGKSIT